MPDSSSLHGSSAAAMPVGTLWQRLPSGARGLTVGDEELKVKKEEEEKEEDMGEEVEEERGMEEEEEVEEEEEEKEEVEDKKEEEEVEEGHAGRDLLHSGEFSHENLA